MPKKLCSSQNLIKKAINEVNLSFVVFDDFEILYSDVRGGVIPVFEFVKTHLEDPNFLNLYYGDKIVGKASSMLLSLLKPKYVYAKILSEDGKKFLEEKHISFEYETLVPYIQNKDKSDKCPFEKAVSQITDPKEALSHIEDTLNKLRKK